MTVLTIHNTPWVERWVDELRTDPPKAIGHLNVVTATPRSTVGRCCLGVLCDIEGVPSVVDYAETWRRVYLFDEGDRADMPGEVFASEHGVDYWRLDGFDLFTDTHGSPHRVDLTDINDHYELTHAQHADLIAYFGISGR